MKFSAILKRVTGLSTPVFGISWTPPESERIIAKRIVSYLEDKRVLFNPNEMEIPDHCFHSIKEIRKYLTEEIGMLEEGSKIENSLRAMRASCRKFADTIQHDENIIRFGLERGHYASLIFISAIGELRGVFGIHLAQIAVQYGLSIEKELASILPIEETE